MRLAFDLVMRFVTSLIGLAMVGMGSVWMMQGLGVGPAAILQGFPVLMPPSSPFLSLPRDGREACSAEPASPKTRSR